METAFGFVFGVGMCWFLGVVTSSLPEKKSTRRRTK